MEGASLNITFIGDVHGKMQQYLSIIGNVEQSVQVGDFGMGFVTDPREYNDFDPTKHRFIRGNHDAPGVCLACLNWIPDGTFDAEHSIFYMGGALSIDRAYRVEGRDWWEDEELSYIELSDVIEKYQRLQPRIMVTHDCPAFLPPMFARVVRNFPSRTATALQTMWEMHRPELWVFGHWHMSADLNVMGTRFICLNELEAIHVNIPPAGDTIR